MSDTSRPSAVLADTVSALAAEAKRLKAKSESIGMDDADFDRLMAVHKLAGELEKARSEALLVMLGARTNVKDMSTDQLQVLASAIMGGK